MCVCSFFKEAPFGFRQYCAKWQRASTQGCVRKAVGETDSVRVEERAPVEVDICSASGEQGESAGRKEQRETKDPGAGTVWRSRRGRKVREGAAGKKDVRG